MGRKVEFIAVGDTPYGTRLHVSVDDLIAAWSKEAASQNAPIPANYASGTGLHETNYTLNEKDTEASGYVTMGVYQLSADEARAAGVSVDDLYTIEGATKAMVYTANAHLKYLLKVTGVELDDSIMPDIWAFLAMAHNKGNGNYQTAAERAVSKKHPGALGYIADYGFDWESFKLGNVGAAINSYGDDCISGGSAYGRAKVAAASLAEDIGIEDKATATAAGSIAVIAIGIGCAIALGAALLHYFAPELV